VLTPLLEPGGRAVFVNRGFIPAELKDPAKRGWPARSPVRSAYKGSCGCPPGGKPAWFLPDNRPDLNYWFWVDLPAMSAARRARPGGPHSISMPMRRRTPEAGRKGGVHPARLAERPPAIRDHVVFPGGSV